MKVYTYGRAEAPVLLLLPGTWCDAKANFEGVLPLLEPDFRVLVVSYDGFDASEPGVTFPTMEEETAKIEDYIRAHCGGHIRAAYGCSLGGSFVGLLAARQNIRMDIGILGSSDLDQDVPWKARLKTDLLAPLVYPLVRDGKFKLGLLNHRMEKRLETDPEYTGAFMRMFGGARPFITLESCKNQFYSDLITPLPDHLDTATEMHIFYALKMGDQYRARYLQHFAHPILHERDLQHEELLVCRPAEWAELVKEICLS